MFRRLTTKERDQLRNECYYSDKLFITHIDVLNDIQQMYNTLSPEEIWSEARSYARKLGKSNRPDKEVGTIYNELLQKYATIKDGAHEQNLEEATREQNAVCVLTCVLYMLCTTEDEVNPYDKVCKAIGNKIGHHPLVKEIYMKQRQSEQEEEEAGEIIPFKDYLHDEEKVEMELIEKRKRRAKTKKLIKQKLLDAFTIINISKKDFEALIDEILNIDGFMDDMEDLEYSKYKEFNRILFCNVVGALKKGGVSDMSYDKIDEGLAFGVHVKNYIIGNDINKNSKHWKNYRKEIEEIIKKYIDKTSAPQT